MKRISRMLTALALVAVAFAGSVPSADAAKCSKKFLIKDAKGDTTLIGPVPAPDSQLDIWSASLAYNKKIKGFVVTVTVDDLQATPPRPPATGEWFVVNVTYKGTEYGIMMIGDELLDGTKEFSMGTSNSQGLYTASNTLKGKYDLKKDQIVWNIPFTAFKSGSGKAIGLKGKFTNIAFGANANHVVPGVVSFSTTADELTTTCPYVIGQEL